MLFHYFNFLKNMGKYYIILLYTMYRLFGMGKQQQTPPPPPPVQQPQPPVQPPPDLSEQRKRVQF